MWIQPTFSHSSESQCPEQTPPLTCQHALPHRLAFRDSKPDGRWWELNFGSQEHLALLSLRAQEDFRHYQSMPCPDTWLTKWHWCWLTSRLQIATVSSEVKMNGSGTEAEILLLLLGNTASQIAEESSLFWLSLNIKIFVTESPGGWVHTVFFRALCPPLQWPQGNTKKPDGCQTDSGWIPETHLWHRFQALLKAGKFLICPMQLASSSRSILLCADIFCISYSERRRWKTIAPDNTPSHNPQFDLNALQPEVRAWW